MEGVRAVAHESAIGAVSNVASADGRVNDLQRISFGLVEGAFG